MKKNLICLIAVGLLFGLTTVFAGQQHELKGVIKSVKSEQKKLTITHGPIKTLGMDGMTMDFKVYDPAMLDEVSKGHMVEAMIEVDKAGNFVIMEIEDKGKAEAGSMASGSHSHDHKH